MSRKPNIRPRHITPLVFALVLLAGVGAERIYLRGLAVDASPYHRRIREAADCVPDRINTMWFGDDVPVTPSAVALLKPNLLLQKRFQHLQSGQDMTFLLVQCSDARDILGHYPPVCYVSQGYSMASARKMDWKVGHWTIEGVQYEFSTIKAAGHANMIVWNFMILPDGSFCRDMQGVDRIGRNRLMRHFGAAQVQFVSSVTLPETEREKFFEAMMQAAAPLIDAIRRGVQ